MPDTLGIAAVSMFIGFILGVLSTLYCTRREIRFETIVSGLVLGIWLAFHTYAILYDKEVSLIMDFVGAGAFGNFVGVKLPDIANYVIRIGKK